MSTVSDFWVSSSQPLPTPNVPLPPVATEGSDRPLHRIAEVRRNQGISVRSAARRMHTSMEQVRRQEDPHSDLPLSELYHWQQALEVPIADLLVESDSPLSEPILSRAAAAGDEDGAGDERVGRFGFDPAIRDDARAATRRVDARVERRRPVALGRPATLAR